MERNILILSLLLLICGCHKDQNKPADPNNNGSESYIANLILPDPNPPYEGDYFIHVNFTDQVTTENKQLTIKTYPKMTVFYSPSETGVVMAIQMVRFTDVQTSEDLAISFDFNLNQDKTFNVCYANYYFSDPLKNLAGANIHYDKPIENSNPRADDIYLGTNSATAYFRINYIGNNRLNGIFHTTWKEFNGGKSTYDVTGEFSIPDMRYLLK